MCSGTVNQSEQTGLSWEGGTLKETGAKRVNDTAALDSIGKVMCFLNIKVHEFKLENQHNITTFISLNDLIVPLEHMAYLRPLHHQRQQKIIVKRQLIMGQNDA